jgi:hypothetical protein
LKSLSSSSSIHSKTSSTAATTTTDTTTTQEQQDQPQQQQEENENIKLSNLLLEFILSDQGWKTYFGPHVLCRDYLRFFDLTSDDTRQEFLQIINNDYFPFLLDEYILNNPHEKDNRDKFENSRHIVISELYRWLVDEVLTLREEAKQSKFKKVFGDTYSYYRRSKKTN